MEKIAILSLAYREPQVLSAFTQIFDSGQFKFFVHVDKKISLNSYRSTHVFKNSEFLENRFEIFWGGYSMVRATMALAKYALKNSSATHFALISDDTFPLLACDELCNVICSVGDRIHFWPVQEDQPVFNRYRNFYYFDSTQSSPQYRVTEDRFVSEKDIEAYVRLHSLVLRGKKPLHLHSGSQWWILTRDSLVRCLNIAESDPWLCESFEFSAIPDEMVFQTLYRWPGFSNRGASRASTYVDFEKNPKPFVFSTPNQINRASINSYVFIRKVSYNPELLNYLSGNNSKAGA